MIGWIAVGVGLILCVIEKWLRSRHIGATLVSLVIYFLIQISINNEPLKCVQDMLTDALPDGTVYSTLLYIVKFIPIVQTVICVLFSFLYSILLFIERNVTTE